MAIISNLKPDQVLWSVISQKMGNTTIRRKVSRPVRIIEIDPDGRFVKASVAGAPARRYTDRHVGKWKVNEPKPVSIPLFSGLHADN